MKKFYLLLALVLMAGVVQAQTQKIPNFGSRANLKQAVRLDAEYPQQDVDQTNGTYHDNNNDPNGTEIVCHNGWKAEDREMYWSGANQNGGVNNYEVEIFNSTQIQNFLNQSENQGKSLLDIFENFVIHSDYAKNWKRYYGTIGGWLDLDGPANGNPKIESAVSYALMFYGDTGDGTLREFGIMRFWDADVVIAPLRAIRGTNEALNNNNGYQKGEILPDYFINRIRSVRIASNSHDGRIKFGDAYFISALPDLDFKDKNGVDIGNAYIDPSFLIPSNRLSIDIKGDRSFEIVAKAGNEAGSIYFSLPYKTGIDMSNVTFHQIDFDRTLNVFSRYIVENKIRNIMTDADDQYITVRDLYNSRYSGAFYDQSNGANAIMGGTTDKPRAIQHVNNIYWEMYAMETNQERRVWVQDICFTKNKIQARLTRKPLELTDWTQYVDDKNEGGSVEGFRNREYPVQPYYTTGKDYSDVVRGDWNDENTFNYTDLSKYNKMRIIGSPNTQFDIRYATSLSNEVNQHYNVPVVSEWKTITVRTDKRGEINDSLYASGEVSIDLDYLKAKDNSQKLYLGAISFNGLESIMSQLGNSTTPGLRKNYWCNDVELYEGEGRLVDLVGSADPNNKSNMYHVWNNDNNYQWQYATVVRWAAANETGLPWGSNFEQKNYSENSPANCTDGNVIWGTGGMYPEYYADLTGYNAIRVYGTSGNVRFVFNTMRNGQAPFLNDNSYFLDARGKGDHDNNNFLFRQERTIAISNHDEKGTYAELDISNYEYFHLNGIKASGDVSGITAIKLVEDEEADYVFYGNGSYGEQGRAAIDHSVNMASNDLTAKVIDARARCNNMQVPYPEKYPNSNEDWFGYVEHITLPQTASQNVLFISRNDQFNRRKIGDHVEYQTQMPTKVVDGTRVNRLDETPTILYDPDNIIGKNDYVMNDKDGDPLYGSDVILYNNNGQPKTKIVDDIEDFNLLEVSGDENVNEYTCTNLKLVDGLSFYAPKKIKAGTATYTRTFKNANVVNSIILPFAVEAGNDTEKKSAGFYKTDVTLESTATEGKVGILEEQDVKKGDWLLQFTKKTGTTEPNTPYLYAVTTGTGEHVFYGVATEDGKVIVDETPDVQVPAHLNMTNNLPNATDPTYAFYLRGVYEGTYLEHILFYAADGTLYRTPYMTVTPFRTIIKSPIDVTDKTWETDEDNYFKPSGNVKVVLAFNGDDSSLDINSLVSDGLFAEDEPIYNLAGQRVNTFDKGVYIVGGKKILVK